MYLKHISTPGIIQGTRPCINGAATSCVPLHLRGRHGRLVACWPEQCNHDCPARLTKAMPDDKHTTTS